MDKCHLEMIKLHDVREMPRKMATSLRMAAIAVGRTREDVKKAVVSSRLVEIRRVLLYLQDAPLDTENKIRAFAVAKQAVAGR